MQVRAFQERRSAADVLALAFAVTIAISVLISAFNALTLSPALSALLLRPRREGKGGLARFFGWFNRSFARATRGYVDLSHRLVGKAAVWLVLLGAFAVLPGGPGRDLPSGLTPVQDQGLLPHDCHLPWPRFF